METLRLLAVSVLALGLAFCPAGNGFAAEKKFPTKAIQVIIPFQPGSTDVLLRPFVEKIPEYLGQPLTYIYKPGAAGSLGAGFVASSKPDGYTLLGTSQSSITVVPLTQKVSYTWRSFAPIICAVDVPNLCVVKGDARWKDLKEFVAEAKKNPGQISFTSSGAFGSLHITGEALASAAGIKLNHIPSQGSAPSVTAVLGGHVDMNIVTMAVVIPHLKAGTMRALCVFAKKRLSFLPDVPTAEEMGYPVFTSGVYGLLAPKETPKEIVETVYEAAKKVQGNHGPAIRERYEKMGVQLEFLGPEEYRTLLQEEEAWHDKIIKDIKKAENK
jgi:tripartite-type tricarboxylate transporter receptor subunit TctC